MFNYVAPTMAIEPVSAPIRNQNEIEGVIKSMAAQPHGGLVVAGDNFVSDPPVSRLIIDLAVTYRLPALYGELPFAQDGGLISYGVDRIDQFKRAASYVDRILKGETPPTFLYSSRRNSNSSSTSRRPRHSASSCR